MSRTSLAVERWQRIVRRQRSSGLGVAEFCRRHGVAASSLFAWKRRLGPEAEASATPAFVALRPAAEVSVPVPSPDSSTPIELHLGAGSGDSGVSGGRWLILRRGFDTRALREVLAVLEGQA